MNYIRGAVNAISAPYQYYRDLPPINPSTLTGAIDVIVVKRPASNGATELACSPFHVRFGKWQVLRPGEKMVKVSINGHTIPFDMKIGEAGEAFFVFETDDDVPADLITSPLLQPTRPDEAVDVPTDRFGAKQDPDQQDDLVHPDGAPEETVESPVEEPEFLDLNAGPSTSNSLPGSATHPSQMSISAAGRVSPPLERPATPGALLSMEETQDRRVDQALKVVRATMEAHEVSYKPDIAHDVDGYHSERRHDRDRTITEADDGSYRSRTPSPSPRVNGQKPPSLNSMPKLDVEYSWEWGAFPQPSPMKASFGMGGRAEGGLGSGKDASATWGRTSRGKAARMGELDMGMDPREAVPEEDEDAEIAAGGSGARSRSVPPALDGSPSRSRRRVRALYDEDDDEVEAGERSVADEIVGYGAGGRLSASQSDPTKFTVAIEGKKVGFELGIVSLSGTAPDGENPETDARGRRDRDGTTGGTRVFDRRDEVEASRLFEMGLVDLNRFLEDETVVNDAQLVIRWAGDQYITRSDGSPLMDALVLWRDSLVKQMANGIPLRPTSPASDEEDATSPPSTPPADEAQEQWHNRSKSEPLEQPQKGKPTSSSWVQWWSRSKRGQTEGPQAKEDRPPLASTASAPNTWDMKQPLPTRAVTDIPPADSAPAPSTPVQLPVQSSAQAPPPQSSPERPGKRKFAKTLRLTSDQLKSLNLKPGANSITFSLSTSGAIACTARIFVWDSTDVVLVSDIDGTITKSDGLGHVFAMIGRDWTHLGVAKLYTDITRNGYKIMYLTSRAIGQADATRDYLKGIKQNDYQLPEGPVIMSPDRLMASLHREVVLRKPEVFKMACLRDIQRLFGEASRNPFYAGFGNRITDALSYRSVNVPSSRIFTIDSSGEVKLELLELAGYKSSYIHMTDLVDQMFPPIHRKMTPEYTDFNYWKAPVQDFQLPDLSPPSPALSARSDTSNQSTFTRLRNFSLVSSRQASSIRQSALSQVNGHASGSRETSPPPEGPMRSADLRQMSSFERLSNTLSSSFGKSSTLGNRRSLSPESRSSSSTTYADSEDEEGSLDSGEKRRRERRRSMTSMPGSLHDDDDMQFDMDDDDEPVEYEEPSQEALEEEEEAFDEDLLAAGEMKHVPFL
ncbi:nuclear elongation and deformation protein 1 [Mycena belliarum]|uniref:phosphatidate phosphatase n=1 Tax=Mycena belliarum TaxID=1033014 RepID=A0AAD6UCH2_9AGAR|nr:nuclear elongation and deformation protein 1 [Mycena belliae]